MAKINQKEYEILKDLDVEWNWIARDERGILGCYMKKPKKYKLILKLWSDNISPPKFIDDSNFQFIQWEDEDPYNIQELIDEYESEYHIENAKIVKLDASKLVARDASDYKHFYKRLGESEETEVSFKENLKQEVEKIMTVTEYDGGWTVVKKVDVDKLFDVIDQLDEPTLSKKVQLSQKSADELNRYKERGYSLKDLLVIAGSKQAQEKLARAWLGGYEVEKEPKYRVRLKVITDEYIASYLRTQSSDAEDRLKVLEIGSKYIHEDYRHLSEFTEDELKRLDIWDSDQWEIEELEE